MQLSDIQASPDELRDYYAQLREQHVAPAWIGGGISIEPRSEAVPYLWRWRDLRRRLYGPPSWSEPSRQNAGFCA
jgi:gentisate 1,2-dioxygenase